MFILSAQRDGKFFNDYDACRKSFEKYSLYLEENKDKFPPNAYSLATSDWYFNFQSHQCPHDSWLEDVIIRELHSGKRSEKRAISITIKLLAAYHDGYIMLHYPLVYSYQIKSPVMKHCDWRYDEFRLSDKGHLIHEIEWSGVDSNEPTRWIIESSDIYYSWLPIDFSQLTDLVDFNRVE